MDEQDYKASISHKFAYPTIVEFVLPLLAQLFWLEIVKMSGILRP